MDEPTRALLSKDAFPVDVFPDHGVLSVATLDRRIATEAAFLDYRTIRYQESFRVALEDVDAACDGRALHPRPLHYLFHVGFCGSTLISRCLGDMRGVLALREPSAFHGLAAWKRLFEQQGRDLAEWSRYCDGVEKLLHAYAPTEAVLVKPSDICVPLIDIVLARHPSSRVLFLYTDVETYLMAVLGDDTRSVFVRDRVRDMRHYLRDDLAGIDTARMSEGERGALLWWMYMEIYARSSSSVHVPTLNFESFLQMPTQTLLAVADHFGVQAGSDVAARALARHGSRYSKNPRQAFSAADRARAHANVRSERGEELRKGLRMLERLGGNGLVAARRRDLFAYRARSSDR